jgi:hypothetical protein
MEFPFFWPNNFKICWRQEIKYLLLKCSFCRPLDSAALGGRVTCNFYLGHCQVVDISLSSHHSKKRKVNNAMHSRPLQLDVRISCKLLLLSHHHIECVSQLVQMLLLRDELLHRRTIEPRHLYTQPHYWQSSPGLHKNFGPCLRKLGSEVTKIFRSLFLDIRNKKNGNWLRYVTLCKTLAGRGRPISPSSPL